MELRGRRALPPAERKTPVTNWLENPSRAGQAVEQSYPHVSCLQEAYKLQSKESAPLHGVGSCRAAGWVPHSVCIPLTEVLPGAGLAMQNKEKALKMLKGFLSPKIRTACTRGMLTYCFNFIMPPYTSINGLSSLFYFIFLSLNKCE